MKAKKKLSQSYPNGLRKASDFDDLDHPELELKLGIAPVDAPVESEHIISSNSGVPIYVKRAYLMNSAKIPPDWLSEVRCVTVNYAWLLKCLETTLLL